MHYYKRNIGDYAKKAGKLSMLQHGAYTLLIDACYDRERFPTLDDAMDWAWAESEEEQEAVRVVLRRFFTLRDGVYVQDRITEELESYKALSEVNSRIAKQREADKKARKSTKREPIVNEPAPNHKPLTTNQEPLTSKSGSAKRRTQLPENFEPNQTGIDKAVSKGLSLSTELQKFTDYHRGKGTVMLDWQAAFRTWIGNARPSPVTGETAYQRTQREKMQQWAPGIAAKAPNQQFTLEAEHVTFIESNRSNL